MRRELINEAVLAIGEELADIQRARDVLVAGRKILAWDQEHGDGIMPHLAAPLQVPWMFSRKCNLHCKHCYNSSSGDYDSRFDAPPELIADRIIEAQPYAMCLCGGEPFIWDPFYDIVRRLRVGGIPLVSTVTNGYCCTPEALAKARDCGLTAIQFSIDGADAEQHNHLRAGDAAYDKVCAALKEALQYSWVDLSISMVPHRGNIGHVRRYVEQFADLGVRHLRFQPYMPLGRGAENAADLNPTADEYMRFHFDLNEMQIRHPDVIVDWGDPLEHIWFYTATEASCWTAGVSTDGWLELSPYLPVLVGDIKKHSIQEIWSKGINEMWRSPLVRRFAQQIHSTDAFMDQEVRMYQEESLHIDVLNEEQWQALMTTDDLALFQQFSRDNLKRSRP